MKINRHQIAEFKGQGYSYISENGIITGKNIRELFFSGIEKYHIDEKRKLEYCSTCFNIVEGLYKQGLRYEVNNQTYYMFWGFNSCQELPFSISIGKLIDGKIFSINESYKPDEADILSFIVFSHTLIDKVKSGTGGSYRNTIFCKEAFFREQTISSRDICCIENAYDGIKVFKDLMVELLKN